METYRNQRGLGSRLIVMGEEEGMISPVDYNVDQGGARNTLIPRRKLSIIPDTVPRPPLVVNLNWAISLQSVTVAARKSNRIEK